MLAWCCTAVLNGCLSIYFRTKNKTELESFDMAYMPNTATMLNLDLFHNKMAVYLLFPCASQASSGFLFNSVLLVCWACLSLYSSCFSPKA